MSETTVIECPNCGATFKAKSKAALGKKVACPKCQVPFVISAPSSSSKSKKPQQAAAQQDAWDNLWDEEDDLEASPPPREKANRPRGRSPKRNPSSGDSLKWIGLAAIVVIVGGGIGLIALSSGSSSSQKSTDNLASKLMTKGQSEENTPGKAEPDNAAMDVVQVNTAEPKAAAEQKDQAVIASTTPEKPVAPMSAKETPDQRSLTPAQTAEAHLLVYQIVKVDAG
ncbi:MAG: hypothetical protein RLO18_11890, partial [Gimesia chilikensis]